ncbi:MAG: IS4 family transposase [Candidatus Brocadia sapporoensis]
MREHEKTITEKKRPGRETVNTGKQEQTLYCEESRIECRLKGLGEIEIVRVCNSRDENYTHWKALIERYHYLGRGTLYGNQMRYLVRSEHFGWIGALSFSSPAWRLRAREKWIGWNEENRLKYLNRIVCNSRFLIVPWVKVKNLASRVLSMGMRQMKRDWAEQKGVEPVLVETFVEKGRFLGTCYQAANFQHAGTTQGRGRQDGGNEYALPVKDIYLYPLYSDASKHLCEGQTKGVAEAGVPSDWAQEEFGNTNLGDLRLTRRLTQMARDFYAKPQANIPQACQSRARTKAAYRFLDNKESTMETILSSHYQSTMNRIKEEEVVLAVQDTTSLNYSVHPATENLGPISSRGEEVIGLMVHDTMAFNREGTPLGLMNVQCWARDRESYGKKHQRHKLPIEEKESNKWLVSFKSVVEIQKQCPKTVIVSVGDREADIYELFEFALEGTGSPKVLVRAEHNRSLLNEQGQLWGYINSRPVSGIQRIRIPRKGNQPSREAELAIRYGSVELKAPIGKRVKGTIKVCAILALEENVPESATPVKWMLLTTIPVNTFEESVEKLEWYARRWGIEVYHKTLKSGCQIEQRQLGNAKRIEACLAIDMVVAWRIYYLTKLGREVPDVPCTVFFEEAEWKALVAYKTKSPIPPSNPPGLREAVRMVASLGGFLGRKGDGEPGTKTLWLGIQRLDDMTAMWKVFVTELTPHSLSPPAFVQ